MNATVVPWARWVALLFLSLLLAACGGGNVGTGADGARERPLTVTVVGRVTGSGGLSGVTVRAGTRSVVTDDAGFYRLEDVPVPQDGRLVIDYRRDGYAPQQRAVDARQGGTVAVDAKLLAYQTTRTVDPNTKVTVATADGSNVTFPPDAIPADGPVTVAMAVADPTTDAGRAVFPGDFMGRAAGDDGPGTPLESVVFTEISLTDADGNEITQLNAPVRIELRLPEALQDQYQEGDTIPWWSYDEQQATWVREDADPSTPRLDDAEIVRKSDGALYATASVTHFSWWNVDRPIDEHACLCLRVEDGDGQPLVGIQVQAEGVTYNGLSSPTATDGAGRVCLTVKRSESESVPEKIRIFALQGSRRFYYSPTVAEGEPADNLLYSPTLAGSTIDGSGQCVDLERPLVLDWGGEIYGRVTRAGMPLSGMVFYTDYGEVVFTDRNGDYQVQAPIGVPVTLYAPGRFAEQVIIPAGETRREVNIELGNEAPQILRLQPSPAPRVDNGGRLSLSVTAFDSDDPLASLRFQWQADAGDLLDPATATPTWIAPASGTGTAVLTVTVSDPWGGRAEATLEVPYGSEAAAREEGLGLRVLSLDGEPIPGVVAILHGDEASKASTDADGEVQFPGVSEPVWLTLALRRDEGDGDASLLLSTLAELAPGQHQLQLGIDEFQPTRIAPGGTSCDGMVTKSVTVTVPADLPRRSRIDEILLLPYDETFPAAGGTEYIDICPDQWLQNNGKVSYLAVALDAQGGLVAYGALRDVDLLPAADSVTVTVDRTDLIPVTWEGGDALRLVVATYGGIPYEGGLVDTDPLAPGPQAALPNFPFDALWVWGGDLPDEEGGFADFFSGFSEGALEYRFGVRRVTAWAQRRPGQTLTLPAIESPDFGLDGSYDADQGTLRLREAASGGWKPDFLVFVRNETLWDRRGDLDVSWEFLGPGTVSQVPVAALLDDVVAVGLLDETERDALLARFGGRDGDREFMFPVLSLVALDFGLDVEVLDDLGGWWQEVTLPGPGLPMTPERVDPGALDEIDRIDVQIRLVFPGLPTDGDPIGELPFDPGNIGDFGNLRDFPILPE